MNTRLKRENRGVLIIFILIIILFFSNIFGASGANYDAESVIDNAETYNLEEQDLQITITNIDEAITTEYDCTTLHIAVDETYFISGEETYCYIDLQQAGNNNCHSGKLIIEEGGSLTLTEINTITSGEIDNYGTLNVDSIYIKTGQTNGVKTIFYNSGTINAENGIAFGKGESWDELSDSEFLTFTCGSIINAGNSISFYINKPWFKVVGDMNASKISIYNTDGYNYAGNLIVDGCATIITEQLELGGNVNNVKIYGHIIADDIISTKNMYVSDDNENNTSGILTIGNASNNVKFVVDANSIMNLCFNPTSGGDDLGFCLGYLLYLSNETTNWIGDKNPEAEGDINNNINRSSPYWDIRNIKNNGDSLYSKKIIAAYNSYNDCMEEKNMASFLPIELVSFEYKDGKFIWATASETNNDYFVVEYSGNGHDWVECTEHIGSLSNAGYTYSTVPIIQINKSLFSYFRLKQVDLDGKCSYSRVIAISFFIENPCSDEYEGTKIQIRELRGKWFRRIDGGLIYCDKDNQESH